MSLSPAQQRAIRTALQSGIGLFVLMAVPFLNEVLEWASGNVVEFPDIAILGRAAVAFVAGAFIALLSQIQNWAEDTGRVPSLLKETPGGRNLRESTFTSQGGYIDQGMFRLVIAVLLIIALVLLIIRLA